MNQIRNLFLFPWKLDPTWLSVLFNSLCGGVVSGNKKLSDQFYILSGVVGGRG